MLETNHEVLKWRSLFPQLNVEVRGKKLVYFDNGATTLKPQTMIDAMTKHLSSEVANIHRGIHYFSETGTRKYEESRIKAQELLNAKETHEIIITKGTTESINLVAATFGETYFKAGDVILLSQMEHHSNIVPWQLVAEKNGALIKVIPINSDGEIIVDEYIKLLKNENVRFVSVCHISNTLGTVNPVKELVSLLKEHRPHAHILIDGAQAVAHTKVDVQDLNCDFYVFSAHKVFGPTGLGFLYGKEEILKELPPYQGGGSMIDRVTFEKTTFHDLPNRFEAGTPPIAEGIAFIESLKLLEAIGLTKIKEREDALLHYAQNKLLEIPEVKIIGRAKNKSAVLSFVVDGLHPQDYGTLLDQQGIAIRTGHHCTQPLMAFYGVPATGRASFAFYNTKEEIDFFVEALNKAIKLLK